MNIHFKKTTKAVKTFFSRYGYYALLGVTVCALALVVVFAVPTNNDNVDVGGGAIVFTDPVSNATILKGFSDTELQFNATLNQWESHKAIDFVAPSGTNVLAVYAGTVSDIYNNYMEGTVIVLDHGDNLKTVYKSLDENALVEIGATVSAGDAIGTVGNTAMSEVDDGDHIHFEVWKDDQKINPSAYLTAEDK